ncbi:hypothetical protein LINGRAHAP2_LOCUS3221 [Linum grandiflorum]
MLLGTSLQFLEPLPQNLTANSKLLHLVVVSRLWG